MTAVDESVATSEVEGETATSEGAEHANAGAKAGPSRGGRARACATRARVRAGYLWALLVAWWAAHRTPTDEESRAPRVHRSSVWSQAPASITDLLAYTRSGAWVPGDRHPLLENIGKAYGYGVAVPCSAALYGAAFVLQRPVRLLAVVAFLVLLAVSL